MAQYMITFSKYISDNITLFGFKILEGKQTSNYLKCVNLLMDGEYTFDSGNDEIPYNIEDFDNIKLSSSDIKCLKKLFDLDESNESTSIGIFPDAIYDAWEKELIEDQDSDDDNDIELNDY